MHRSGACDVRGYLVVCPVMPIHRRPDFDHHSINPGKCFVLNRVKGPREEGIFRVGNVDMERGWLDISEGAVGEMANQLGWVPVKRAKQLESDLAEAKARVSKLEGHVHDSRLEVVTEMGVKLDSSQRKVRRYKARMADLESELAELKDGADSGD